MTGAEDAASTVAIVGQLWAMESELDLVGWKMGEYQPWVDLRNRVYEQVRRQYGGGRSAHPAAAQTTPPTPPSITDAQLRRFVHPPPRGRSVRPVLPRTRVAVRGGNRFTARGHDLYTESVLDALGGRAVGFIDSGPILPGPTPQHPDPRIDLRWISAAVRAAMRRGHHPYKKLSRDDTDRAHAIAESVRARFGLELEIAPLVLNRVNHDQLTSSVVRDFVTTQRVRTVALVGANGRHALIEGARQAGAATVELQHGYIGKYHLGFSWPGDQPTYGIPDRLFIYGPYWADSTPLATRAVVTGAPWLPRGTDGSGRRDSTILFMSQGPIGPELLGVAVAVARALPRREVLFHLHPSELLHQFQESAHTLGAPSNLVLSEGTPGKVYDLMPRAAVNVGVSSTTLFEGMAMGCRTVVVDLPSSAYLEDAVARGDAIKVDTAAEFVDRLDEAPLCRDPDYYFAPPVVGKQLRRLLTRRP